MRQKFSIPRNAAAADHEVRSDFEKRSREWQQLLFDNGWAGITWPRAPGASTKRSRE